MRRRPLTLAAVALLAAVLAPATAQAAETPCREDVRAPSAIVIEVSTGAVACSRNADERRSIASDRRQHAISLTEPGRAIAERAIDVQRRWIASTLGRMTEPDLEALEAKLVTLRDIVREAETPEHARAAKG